MPSRRQQFGQWGEGVACQFLGRRGFKIVEKNYHCREGEVDIVAKQGEAWWFIEVKTRRSAASGEPEEMMDEAKLEKTEAAAFDYLSKKEIETDNWQIGFIAIKVLGPRRVRVRFMTV
ncbi:MAG: YraN family protein [Patescibacteria group bacterium]|jgi:putative endonuclease